MHEAVSGTIGHIDVKAKVKKRHNKIEYLTCMRHKRYKKYLRHNKRSKHFSRYMSVVKRLRRAQQQQAKRIHDTKAEQIKAAVHNVRNDASMWFQLLRNSKMHKAHIDLSDADIKTTLEDMYTHQK